MAVDCWDVSNNAKWMWTTGLWVVACSRVLLAKSKAYLRSILGSDGSEGQNLSMTGRPPKTDLLFTSSQHIRAPLHPTKQHSEPMIHQDLVKQLSKRTMLGYKIPRPAGFRCPELSVPMQTVALLLHAGLNVVAEYLTLYRRT